MLSVGLLNDSKILLYVLILGSLLQTHILCTEFIVVPILCYRSLILGMEAHMHVVVVDGLSSQWHVHMYLLIYTALSRYSIFSTVQ